MSDSKGGCYSYLFGLAVYAVLKSPLMVDPEGATQTLKQAGFTNIEIKGGRWFGGSAGDFWRTEFNATSPSGTEANGYVSDGVFVFKGSSIRFDNE